MFSQSLLFAAWRDLAASADDALDVMFGAMHTPGGLVLFTVPTWAGDPGRAASPVCYADEIAPGHWGDPGPAEA